MIYHTVILLSTLSLAACATRPAPDSPTTLQLEHDGAIYLVDEYAAGTYSRACGDVPHYFTAERAIDEKRLDAIADLAESSGFFALAEQLPTQEPPARRRRGEVQDERELATVVTTSHCAQFSLRIARGKRSNTVHWDCDTVQGVGHEPPVAVRPLLRAIERVFSQHASVRDAPRKFCGYR